MQCKELNRCGQVVLEKRYKMHKSSRGAADGYSICDELVQLFGLGTPGAEWNESIQCDGKGKMSDE